MKAYQKGGKLYFKDPIMLCINDINRIIHKLEDKNNDIFPYKEISKFIEDCKYLYEYTENINVKKEFVDYVKENKEIVEYFKSNDKKYREVYGINMRRKELIEKFKDDIKDLF